MDDARGHSETLRVKTYSQMHKKCLLTVTIFVEVHPNHYTIENADMQSPCNFLFKNRKNYKTSFN